MSNRAATLGWVAFSLTLVVLVISQSGADTPPAGYNTPIPSVIMTPDTVPTRLGMLEFFDGLPTEETTALCWDNLDFMRGVETFLNGIPATSIEALRRGFTGLGAEQCHQAVILDKLMDSNPLFLTGNTDTVYCSAFLDLQRDGPTVVEIPPGCGPGTVNDAYFRFVTDMGAPGPDRGKGGKYLILPPGSDMEAPEGYFVSTSTSYVNWLILRGFLVDGKTDTAVKMFEGGLKIYPYAAKAAPPAMSFTSGSAKVFNTIHANTFAYYQELADVIQREPVEMLDPELRGLFASIGIQKGKPFAPDARLKKTLTDAVAVGNATARAMVFHPRNRDGHLYSDREWRTAFVGGDYQWLLDDGMGGRNLDARSLFFYFATVNTPAMALKMVGKGSQYAVATLDKDGHYLDGAKAYTLNIPANVPAKDFWSVVVYDPQTRSQLQTSQPFPSKNDMGSDLEANADGSVDLHFGPTPPAGKERNWIQTMPGKGWFAILRLYGPLEPFFDRTWKPGDIELQKK